MYCFTKKINNMKKVLLGVVAFMIVGGTSLISLQAKATEPVSGDPCPGCNPPGSKCCTSAAGDDYYGTRGSQAS